VTALLGLVPMPYRLLALALLAAALWGHGFMKGANHGEQKLAAYVAEVRLAGVAAQAAATARAAADRDRKAASDASYRKALTLAGNDLKRLRDASSGRYIVSTPSPIAGVVDTRACFDAEQLNTAIREFAEGAAAIVGRGEAMRLRLDNAIQWAR
jgi:hypothetical protein